MQASRVFLLIHAVHLQLMRILICTSILVVHFLSSGLILWHPVSMASFLYKLQDVLYIS